MMSRLTPSGSGGRVCLQADARKARSKLGELAILGSEVVSPLADTVRLVDSDERDVARLEEREKAVAPFADQTLRRHVEQTVASFSQSCRDECFFSTGKRAVVERGGHAVADERVDLVLHQRDER